MSSNIIKKQIQLNNRAAASLFKKYETINQLGTGILTSIQNIINQQFAQSACVLLTLDQLKKVQQGEQRQLLGWRTIYIKLQSFHFVSIEAIQKLLEQLQNLRLVSSNFNHFSGFLLEWNQQLDHNQFIKAIRYLQYRNFVILIEPQTSFNSWKDYQLSLNNFSYLILQSQNLFLASISLILPFPPLERANYSKMLLSVWNRVLPCGIGRIVLKDNSQQDYLSSINDLFHVKGARLNWKIQFMTSRMNSLQQLQQRVLGIS